MITGPIKVRLQTFGKDSGIHFKWITPLGESYLRSGHIYLENYYLELPIKEERVKTNKEIINVPEYLSFINIIKYLSNIVEEMYGTVYSVSRYKKEIDLSSMPRMRTDSFEFETESGPIYAVEYVNKNTWAITDLSTKIVLVPELIHINIEDLDDAVEIADMILRKKFR